VARNVSLSYTQCMIKMLHLATLLLSLLGMATSIRAQTTGEPVARCADFERQSNGFLLQFQRGFATPELFQQNLSPVLSSFERCLDSPTSKRIAPKTLAIYKRQVAGLQVTADLFTAGTKTCFAKAKAAGATTEKPINCDWTELPAEDGLMLASKKHPHLVAPPAAKGGNQKLGELSRAVIKVNVFPFAQH
jgi:hypothetical protein